MKKTSQWAIVLLLLSACKPAAYFNTPNDVHWKEGTVQLVGGGTRQGQISISFETNYGSDRYLQLRQNGLVSKIPVDSVESYSLRQEVYVLKRLEGENLGETGYTFLKRLTALGSRIQLFELEQHDRQSTSANIKISYFLSFPSQYRLQAWELDSKYLVPGFDEKMANMVTDCDTLAAKIRQRQKGYYLSQFLQTNSKKLAVVNKIIEEYNHCK